MKTWNTQGHYEECAIKNMEIEAKEINVIAYH